MSRTTRRVAARTTALVALTALLAACGSIKEDVEERVTREVMDQALGDDVELHEDGFSVETEDGRTLDVGSNALPDAWPSDLPVPDGGQVLSSVVQDGEDGTEMVAMIQFDGGLEDVRPEVEDALAGTSWTPDGDAVSSQLEDVQAWAQAYTSGGRTTKVNVVDNGTDTTVSWEVHVPTGG